MVNFGKISIQGIHSFHGKRVGHHYDELGGQFENLLRFLEMRTPRPSQVTNDEPPQRTNRILHNLAAFYQKSIFGRINSKTKQIKTSHHNSIENMHIDY